MSKSGASMSFNLRRWRSNLRLASGLVLLAFVICHLSAHSLLLISIDRAEAGLKILMYPWRDLDRHRAAGLGAAGALRERAVVDLPAPLAAPVALGVDAACARPLHPGAADGARGVDAHRGAPCCTSTAIYSTLFIVQWQMEPWLAFVQPAAVLTVWVHACIGIHFWLRTKPWYPNWRPYFFGVGLLLPALALVRLRHGRQPGACARPRTRTSRRRRSTMPT